MKRFFQCITLFWLLALLLAPGRCLAQAVLRAGDTVEIRLSGVPAEEIASFSAPQTVDDSGMLNMPYIGKIKVAGLDADKAQQLIESKLKADKIYTNPTVTLGLGNSRYVNVTGEVKSPGRIAYTADMTLMSAIAGASGFNDFADKKHVKLTRDGKVTEYDTRKFIKDPSLDVKVLPGDQVTVLQAGIFN